jgi:hypothetical protein
MGMGEVPRVRRKKNLERAAVYLRTHLDEKRAWGQIATPEGTLHAKDIEVGLGMNDDEGKCIYIDMKEDGRFNNPLPPGRIACFELTDTGLAWADRLIAKGVRA